MFFVRKKIPPTPPSTYLGDRAAVNPTTDCKHYNAYIRGEEVIGRTTCPDCKSNPHIIEVLNNWFDRLRNVAPPL